MTLLVGAASIAFYAAVSATVNGEPSTSPYRGFVALLQPAAAQMAILEGEEAITRKLLDTIPVDHAAESGQHGAA